MRGAPTKKRGKQKQVAPAAATGNKGGAFERRVQAQRLMAMCTGTSCPGLPSEHRILALSFQARVHDCNTDDLVCMTQDGLGNKSRVLMQMKRTLSLGDEGFEEAVGLAWIDFQAAEFGHSKDRFESAHDRRVRGGL